MKINRKIQNIGLIAVAGLSLIGLIIGTFLDQQITAKMGDANNMFGILFTAFGPVFTLALGTLCGALLFFLPKQEKLWLTIFCKVLGAVAIIGFTFFSVKEGFAYVDFPRMQGDKGTYKALIAVLIGLIDLAILLFTNLYIKKLDEKIILRTVVVIFIIFAAWFFVSEVMKYLASRPRPRVIDQAIGIEYRPWYAFHPFEAFKEPYKDCKSFVSGHAFNSACLITILPLIFSIGKKENNDWVQTAALSVGALWAFVVAFSRIIARAHFMSDVMGGILLSAGAQALIINLEPVIMKKHE